MAVENLTRRTSFTMSREALACHIDAIEDRISKAGSVLTVATEHVEGQTRRMVLDAIEVVDEQMVQAQRAIDQLKSEAGIKVEERHG
jgi:hypothetical protein